MPDVKQRECFACAEDYDIELDHCPLCKADNTVYGDLMVDYFDYAIDVCEKQQDMVQELSLNLRKIRKIQIRTVLEQKEDNG